MRLDKIQIFYVTSSETALHMYEQGGIDWVGAPFTFLPQELFSPKKDKPRFQIKSYPRSYPFWIYINTQFFPSSLIRKALSCVIDRHAVTDYIFVNRQPLFGPLTENFSYCDTPILDFDLSKGKALFEQGLQDLGITLQDFPTVILSCCQLEKHRQLAEYLQERWSKAFGIRVQLKAQDWSTFYESLKEGEYHIGGAFLSGNYDSPLAYLEQLAEEGNFSQWEHKRYRHIIQDLKKGKQVDRLELLREAERILQEQMPIIPVFNGSCRYAHTPSLKGFFFDFKGIPDFSFAYFEK